MSISSVGLRLRGGAVQNAHDRPDARQQFGPRLPPADALRRTKDWHPCTASRFHLRSFYCLIYFFIFHPASGVCVRYVRLDSIPFMETISMQVKKHAKHIAMTTEELLVKNERLKVVLNDIHKITNTLAGPFSNRPFFLQLPFFHAFL